MINNTYQSSELFIEKLIKDFESTETYSRSVALGLSEYEFQTSNEVYYHVGILMDYYFDIGKPVDLSEYESLLKLFKDNGISLRPADCDLSMCQFEHLLLS